MNVTAFDIAQRFVGTKEVSGAASNPQILAMLRLDAGWPSGDDVPWCSAFVNYVAWLLRLPRSKSLAARSWLEVGSVVGLLSDARAGFDVVVLKRGGPDEPGPDVLLAPGHVGFFAGSGLSTDQGTEVAVLGGNQGNTVSIAAFPIERVLGIRRLA